MTPSISRSCSQQLDMLDKMINSYAEEHPDFVTNYQKARIIVDSGIRHDSPEDAADKREG